MKVLLVNGSPKKDGNTADALKTVAKALEAEGVQTEIVCLGGGAIADCIGCGRCAELGKCTFDDIVNELAEKAKEADGFVFGTPVYYAHPSARLLAVMDRLSYSGGKYLKFKPAAAIAVARRAGTVASMDVINKHFSINSMPIVSSTYWNQAYGAAPGQAAQDTEGMMTMTNIGKNMAWMLKCIEAGKEKGINAPENEKIAMNFIR